MLELSSLLFSLFILTKLNLLSLTLHMLLFIWISLNLHLSPFLHYTPLTSFWLSLDRISWVLLALTLLITLMMTMSTYYASSVQHKPLFMLMMTLLLFILSSIFMITSSILFYFMFEFSLLPIFIIILGWGYQFERLSAALSMFLYTTMASIPLLVAIIWMLYKSYNYLFFDFMSMNLSSNKLSTFLSLALILAFLVKFPMFPFHLWLPKAHVEAPVAGSMILAAVLLKLGGYGMTRLLPAICNSSLPLVIQPFSLWGGLFMSILCLRQSDMKILIAYSSVCHMSMAISSALIQSYVSLMSLMLIMVAHGISSSGMFFLANSSYEKSKSRNMIFIKSLLSSFPLLALFWFLMCLLNMGTPPTINFFSEISSIMALLSVSNILTFQILGLTFFAVVFTVILFSTSQQGQIFELTSLSSPVQPNLILISCSHLVLANSSILLMSIIF